MRAIAPSLCLFIAVTTSAAEPAHEAPPAFQMFPADLRAAAGIMDEALKDVWHENYLQRVKELKEFHLRNPQLREPLPAEEPPPPEVSDEVFIRRATLDATDVIPTAEEVRAFLADSAPDKRSRLVDRLLLSPGRAQRQFNRYADMMRLRDNVGGIPQTGYIGMVRFAAEENFPFDRFVETLLTASGNVPDNPATGFLLRDQGNLLQTVDELEWSFLHENVHCAVCHDHPYGETTQREFYELASCFGATQVVLRQPNPNGIFEKEVWPADAYRAARSIPASRDGLLTIRDTRTFSLHIPGDYKYRNAKPNQLLKKGVPVPMSRAFNADHPTWTSPKGLRSNFAHWLVTQDRFAQVAGMREWISLFGGKQVTGERIYVEPASLLPGEAEGGPGRNSNSHAACCDSTPWNHDEFGFIDWGYESSATEKKFLFAMSALMRHVRFDLREFQRVLMNTKAYARMSTSGDFLGQPRFSRPLAPVVRRLSPEQLWNSLVLLGGVDGPDWRFASELPQTLPENHGLRVLGRGLRMHSDDSSRVPSYSLARFMMNSDAVRHATEGKISVVTRTEAQWKNSPVNQVEPLFLAILGRAPDEREHAESIGVASQPDGLRQLAWSLLNTSEFVFEQ